MVSWQERVEKNQCFVAWGFGDYLFGVIRKLPLTISIKYACDSNKEKWGTETRIGERVIKCVSPEQLKNFENLTVLIASQSKKAVDAISNALDEMEIKYIHINEILRDTIHEWDKNQIAIYDNAMLNIEEPPNKDTIVSFISVSVPIAYCNLQCPYCYVGQQNIFGEKNVVYHSPEFIKRALSRKRLGGTALINFCGTGETLLCNEIEDIIKCLLEEGHYISIITNAILSKRIENILKLGYNDHLFFKCSFHYLELKRKGLLNKFIKNVNLMRRMGSSISVELVPHDELIPYIHEIKDLSINSFGALPHVTVTRDEGKADMPILTNLNEDEYQKIWGQFHSKMFDFKLQKRQRQREYCLAGRGTFILNLDYGGTVYCPRNPNYINIYDEIWKKIDYKDIGNNCQSPYCINAHAYLTLGMVEKCNESSYLEIRDRLCKDGSHWVTGKMAYILSQRICDNLKKVL